MRNVIPIKMIIDLNPDGTWKDGVLLYQIDNDGSLDLKARTVGIKNIMDLDTETATNNTLEKAISLAKKSEGIK
jgi:hypothetical protein